MHAKWIFIIIIIITEWPKLFASHGNGKFELGKPEQFSTKEN